MPFRTASGKLFYRVGDVIISTNNENPSKWYGGTWELFAPGRTLVCIDTSQTEFNSIKKTGGSKYMQQHNHSASTGGAGAHTPSGSISTKSLVGTFNYLHAPITLIRASGIVSTYDSGQVDNYTGTSTNARNCGIWKLDASHNHTFTGNAVGNHTHGVTVNNAGSGNAQNLQPFIVVYMWIRTA